MIITNYNLKKQLDQIQEFIMGSLPESFYDPLEWIQTEDKGERVYKFKGVYYRKKDLISLHKAVQLHSNYSRQPDAFKKLCAKLGRNTELWELGVQPEYVKETNTPGLYVCTDGNILMKNFTPYKHAHNHSNVKAKGKQINRALVVINYFIDPTVQIEDVAMRSMNFSDCRIDNVFDVKNYPELKNEIDKRREAKKVQKVLY